MKKSSLVKDCKTGCFAYIMRGIPGSGKSTRAHAIASQFGRLESVIEDGVIFYKDESGKIFSAIHSTDTFFLDKEGNYNFVSWKLGKYHSLNFKKFKESLRGKIPVVICDNTNTTRKEYKKYFRAGMKHGYFTSVVTAPHPQIEVAVERNSHNVPEDAIKKMLKRWEPYNGQSK